MCVSVMVQLCGHNIIHIQMHCIHNGIAYAMLMLMFM